MDNMTIGPAREIGGNSVQLTRNGRIQVTNPNGKIKTLSQDEFEKNLIKNADKIENGEDFEFKKDQKGLKIALAAGGTAAITAGIIYRKELGKFAQKVWNGIKNLFKSRFDKNAPAGWSKQERHARRNALKETFKNYDVKKMFNARTEFLKKNNVSEEQLSLMQQISRLGKGQEITEEQKALLPESYRTKKACAEFAEKVRSVMLDGPTRVYQRRTFIPNLDNPKLVERRVEYNSDTNMAARKAHHENLKAKYN